MKLMLNKIEFLEKLFGTYTNSWNEKNKTLKMEQYMLVLKKNNIDYDKLYETITEENNNEFMPTPAWILDKIPKCLTKGTAQKWLQVEVYDPILKTNRNNDCFPINTTVEQMIKFYENKFKCSGWEIVKVY